MVNGLTITKTEQLKRSKNSNPTQGDRFEKLEMENVKDIDGNSYKTVKIGNQIWMAENLKVTHYRNGDPIRNETDNYLWSRNVKTYVAEGVYCNYDNDENNVAIYGRLYHWFAVIDRRGLAPKGWHIATKSEFSILMNLEAMDGFDVAGGKMKARGTIEGNSGLWHSPNRGATNESGFTGIPAGFRNNVGEYCDIGHVGYFWSPGKKPMRHLEIWDPRFYGSWDWAWYEELGYRSPIISWGGDSKGCGFSVRCVKD